MQEFIDAFGNNAKPTGEFSVSITHRGAVWKVRMTSNSVKMMSPIGFEVRGCSRHDAVRIVIAVINTLDPRET